MPAWRERCRVARAISTGARNRVAVPTERTPSAGGQRRHLLAALATTHSVLSRHILRHLSWAWRA